jgi:ferredoxin
MVIIKYIPDGKEVECKTNDNLMDVANKADLTIPFGCTDGLCGTCIITVKKGTNNLTGKTEQEKETLELFEAEENQRLACQCKVLGDVELDQ